MINLFGSKKSLANSGELTVNGMNSKEIPLENNTLSGLLLNITSGKSPFHSDGLKPPPLNETTTMKEMKKNSVGGEGPNAKLLVPGNFREQFALSDDKSIDSMSLDSIAGSESEQI